MTSKGKSVFWGLVFTRDDDEIREGLYKDLCKTIGVTYLDL